MRRAVLAVLCGAALAATAAEPKGGSIQLKSSPTDAARCITQKAQQLGRATKTTDPAKGESQVILYNGKEQSGESATLHITPSGQGTRLSYDSRDERTVGVIRRISAGC